MVRALVAVELEAFDVHRGVREVAVAQPPPSLGPRTFRLSELSQEALALLCSDFTEEVFRCAGKEAPTMVRESE